MSQGRRELLKSGGAKSPILPHFSKNSSFIAFLCDNFFGFSKSGGAAARPRPPGPPCYVDPGNYFSQTVNFTNFLSKNCKFPHCSMYIQFLTSSQTNFAKEKFI